MRRRGEYGRLSEAERLEIGDRLNGGQTHAEVAAAIGCSTKSIQRLLVRTGGLALRGRCRSLRHLTVAERKEISRGLRAGDRRHRIPAVPHGFRSSFRGLGGREDRLSPGGRRGRARAHREEQGGGR